MKLQHLTRRKSIHDDGVILVGPMQYEIDGDGCVDVSDEHAGLLLQNVQKLWRPVGRVEKSAPPMPQKSDETPVADAQGLDALTKRQLLDYAISKGYNDVSTQMSRQAILDMIKEKEAQS